MTNSQTKAVDEQLGEIVTKALLIWKQATPLEMVRFLTLTLHETPKRKFIKRLSIKRHIKYWRDRL